MRRFVCVACTCAMLVFACMPLARADVANAAVNGFARASAVYVPFSVNPNFDFWPVYSLSETDGSLSHGIAAGFWPGFLVDATFFQFGYQPAERAFLGAAESEYPTGPLSDESGSTDFARECEAGQVSQVPLPLGLGQGSAPEPLLTGCQSLYTQYKGHIPYSVSSGSTTSDVLQAAGSANGAQVQAGTVTIGSAYSTSYTNASDGKQTDSSATVILNDVQIGGSLRIKELISTVHAVADGSAKDAVAQRSLTIIDATDGGQPVTIGSNGVTTPGGQSLNGALAAQGLQVRIVDGQTSSGPNQSTVDSGALVVRETRDTTGTFGDSEKECTTVSNAYPKPVATVSQSIAPNPLYEPAPPYNQLPSNVSVDQQIVPALPCPLLLFERSVDVGVALGGATASARYTLLPPGLSFPSSPVIPPTTTTTVIPGRTIGSNGAPSIGALLPAYANTPPVPVQSILKPYIFEGLGAGEARGVKAVFGGIFALVLALIASRFGFKALMRT
ncbi:MAG: hypothetical protein ACYDCC_14380 [Actinomycetota bacterium]